MKDMKDWSQEKNLCLLLCEGALSLLPEQASSRATTLSPSATDSPAWSGLAVIDCINARLFPRFGSGRRSRTEALLIAGLMLTSGCRPDRVLPRDLSLSWVICLIGQNGGRDGYEARLSGLFRGRICPAASLVVVGRGSPWLVCDQSITSAARVMCLVDLFLDEKGSASP